MRRQNFRFSMSKYCGQPQLFAECAVCGEAYWVNVDGQPQCNGRVITRCLTKHREQDGIHKQIDAQIEFHFGRC